MRSVNYVRIFVFSLYDLSIWKIVFLWYKSYMGNYKNPLDRGISSNYFNWNGNRRIDFFCIPDFVSHWSYIIDYIEKLIENLKIPSLSGNGKEGIFMSKNKEKITLLERGMLE